MKRFLGFLILAAGGVFGAQASPIWDVAICSGCTSTGQFEAAGRQAAGTGYNGERQILVINPSTKVSRHVLVTNVPPGEVPRSVEPPASIQVGSAIALDHDPDASTYFAGMEAEGSDVRHVMAGSTTSYSWAVSNTEKAEIGALIEFGSKDYVIVLPDSDLFSSFQHRNEPAVANKIYQAMTEKNPGWAVQQLGTNLRKLVQNRLKVFFGRSFQVCAVFNNGDSACFEPDVATPSLENLIAGSAKDASGNPIGSGGGGGGGMNVINDPPTIGYGAPGSSGRTGELWLFCASVGGKLVECWTEVIR